MNAPSARSRPRRSATTPTRRSARSLDGELGAFAAERGLTEEAARGRSSTRGPARRRGSPRSSGSAPSVASRLPALDDVTRRRLVRTAINAAPGAARDAALARAGRGRRSSRSRPPGCSSSRGIGVRGLVDGRRRQRQLEQLGASVGRRTAPLHGDVGDLGDVTESERAARAARPARRADGATAERRRRAPTVLEHGRTGRRSIGGAADSTRPRHRAAAPDRRRARRRARSRLAGHPARDVHRHRHLPGRAGHHRRDPERRAHDRVRRLEHRLHEGARLDLPVAAPTRSGSGPGVAPGIRVRSWPPGVRPGNRRARALSDWTTQAADAVEKAVVLVRDKTVVPAQQGAKVVVYGFLTAFFAPHRVHAGHDPALPGARDRRAGLGRLADPRGNLPPRRRVLLVTPLEEGSRTCLSSTNSSSSAPALPG